ncbi:MAG: hypothetical protein IKV74_07470 [Clostridia bacterium]|nr:hypothetical protein [Clostridia bacterium]
MEAALEDKIKEIGGMLGITEIPDSITDLIGSFINQPENESNLCPNCEQERSPVQEENDAMKMMQLINKYQQAKVSMEQDNNIRLLRALSPYMNKKRRQKIKNCEKMLTILKLL